VGFFIGDTDKMNCALIRNSKHLGDLVALRPVIANLDYDKHQYYLIIPPALNEAADDLTKLFPIKIKDVNHFDIEDYDFVLNVSSCDAHYWQTHGNNHSKIDIFAQHIGITLQDKSFHLHSEEEESQKAKSLIGENCAVVCPVATSRLRSLSPEQIAIASRTLHECGYDRVIGVHTRPINGLETLCNLNYKQFVGVLDAAELVVSVDSAGMWLAGALNRPLVALFSITDAASTTKYFNPDRTIFADFPHIKEAIHELRTRTRLD